MLLAKLDGKPEIFYSIQGEGVSIGRPAIFIRLAGCDLQCQWCDTPYTWRFDKAMPHQKSVVYKPSDFTINLTVDQVVEEIKKFAPKMENLETPRVIITGGEPLLQKKELEILLKKLAVETGIDSFEIETNGTMEPLKAQPEVYIQYNISPKLSGSGNPKCKRERPEILEKFEHKNAFYKFVVSTESDRREVRAFVKRYDIEPWQVYIMPEGITVKEIQRNAKELVDFCKKYGFSFTTRLHILIYGGAKRGV